MIIDQASANTEIDPGDDFIPGFFHFNAPSIKIGYDGYGRKSTVNHSTGLAGTYSYDLLNRATEIKFSGGAERDFSENLAYSLAGDITAVSRETGMFGYSYDLTHRLAASSYKAQSSWNPQDQLPQSEVDRSFGYDDAGNRVADNLNGAASFINDFLVSNQRYEMTADVDGMGNTATKLDKQTGAFDSFSYRADRKLTSFTRAFDEDHFGSHQSQDPLVQNVSYYYDALGRRVAKVFHHSTGPCPLHHGLQSRFEDFSQSFSYLGDRDQILIGRSGDGLRTLYLDGLGIDEHLGEVADRFPGILHGYETDHLGTVINGQALGGQRATGAFGESLLPAAYASDEPTFFSTQTASLLTRDPAQYGFAGRQLDLESGLYYNRARMYDPSTGRFLSADPMFPVSGINPYEYARNNPLQYVDPSGKCPLLGAIIIVGGIVYFGEAIEELLNILLNPNLTPAPGYYNDFKNLQIPPGFNGPFPPGYYSQPPSDPTSSATDPNDQSTSGWYDDWQTQNAGSVAGNSSTGGSNTLAGGPGDAGGVTDAGGGDGSVAALNAAPFSVSPNSGNVFAPMSGVFGSGTTTISGSAQSGATE